jgi:hypothetical protein
VLFTARTQAHLCCHYCLVWYNKHSFVIVLCRHPTRPVIVITATTAADTTIFRNIAMYNNMYTGNITSPDFNKSQAEAAMQCPSCVPRCHPLAKCYNTQGSYGCKCPEGTQGDGFLDGLMFRAGTTPEVCIYTLYAH